MKILIGIQARTTSSRFPNKVNKPLGDKRVIDHVVQACNSVTLKNIDITVAILHPHGQLIHSQGADSFPGDENDLVQRYWDAANNYRADGVVRVTGDCPFIPPLMIKQVILGLMEADYVSNTSPRTFVDGHDVQGITFDGLGWVHEFQNVEREHPFYLLDTCSKHRMKFMEKGFKIKPIINSNRTILNPYHPENKLSLDTVEDYKRLCGIVDQRKS